MSQKPRYLTKSRFKAAMDCPTSLYYTNKPEEYADAGLDDPFLHALADGGFQVGELAKFLFCNDPINEKITIEEKAYDAALQITNHRLQAPKAVIAEAAVKFKNLFIRIDVLTKNKKELRLYEVKAKSWSSEKSFWNKRGDSLSTDWMPYLYDVAFQKYVVENAFPDYKVKAYLVLVDKDAETTITSLNQHFKIVKGVNRNSIRVKEGTTADALGKIPLRTISVDKECDWIYKNPAPVDLEQEYSFFELIEFFSEKYSKDERIWSAIGSKCKSCSFQEWDSTGLKSGFHECWRHQANFTDADFKKPMVLELWGGKAGSKSLVGDAIAQGKYWLHQLTDDDHFSKNYKPKEAGLHPSERRKIQIEQCTTGGNFYLDRKGLKRVFKDLPAPWHFIDFETSMVALPFHKGRSPYEATAFQYSYHVMDEKGNIQHKSQYLSLDQEFPNYDFLRSLKIDLEHTTGTVFRYHNHENSYLNFICAQLQKESRRSVPDKNELIDFALCFTHDNTGRCGGRDMQDLYELVLSYYYSPYGKGSNSLKYILPAAINDSAYMREKYSKPVYGTQQIPSLNFENHVLIDAALGCNPYNTLPAVMEGYTNEQLDEEFSGPGEIAEGGAAMMAYAYLQFSEVPAAQKEAIRQSLLRYCELDTMAMVMLWEFWRSEVE